MLFQLFGLVLFLAHVYGSFAALQLLMLASLLHAININHEYTSQLPSLAFKQRCVPFSLMIINYEVREVKFHQIFSSFQQQNIMYYWRHLLFFTRDPPLSILKTFKSIQDLISLMDIQINVCKWSSSYPYENREVLVYQGNNINF